MADPRPPRRIKDPELLTELHIRWRGTCVLDELGDCLPWKFSLHHIHRHPRDDVRPNLAMLCGDGTTGHHGLITAEDEDARRALGEYLLRYRLDTLTYLTTKLGGDVVAAEWFRTALLVTVQAAAMPTALFDRTFQAAHRLLHHEGKCSRVHGHNFAVSIHIETDHVGEDDFVVEFDHVKDVIDQYDHRLILNEEDDLRLGDPADASWYVHVPGDPTTEFMAQYLAHELAIMVRRKNERAGAIRVHVTLRETDSIAAMGVAFL